MYVVCQLAASPAEYGRKFHFAIKLIDQDATQEIVKLASNATVPTKTGVRQQHLNFLFKLNHVRFPAPGVYEFTILIDNDPKRSIPIFVNQIEEPEPPPST
ncbi:MAG: hypothetical protein GYB68_00865 [Chloroflexi bacterium]|nr:hypothetical protein [Chloroflexota bacterium]